MKNVAYTAYKMLIDGTGSCYYAMTMGVRHFRIFEYINAATGWDKTPDQYIEIGIRMQHMRQLFNAIQRVDVSSFRPHGRVIGEEPLKTGHNAGITIKIDEMVRLYREAWGWDEDSGYPLEATLEAYGINELIMEGIQHA